MIGGLGAAVGRDRDQPRLGRHGIRLIVVQLKGIVVYCIILSDHEPASYVQIWMDHRAERLDVANHLT